MAMKQIKKRRYDAKELNVMYNEVKILQKLVRSFLSMFVTFVKDHPNILKIHEFYEDNNNFYIIMDFLNGGELYDKLIEKLEN